MKKVISLLQLISRLINQHGNFYFLILVLVIFCCLFLKSAVFLDPDFGWHLKTGQVILSTGTARVDPFSYTMPSFPYVDHAWMPDLVMAKIFTIVHFSGLAVIVSAIALISLLISYSISKAVSNIYRSIPLILGATMLLTFVAVRPLVIGWIFFSTLLWVVFDAKRFRKFKWLLPLFFLFWANLHGDFGAGLIVLAIVIAIEAFTSRQLKLGSLAVLGFSIGVTLLNPYGLGLWHEVVTTLGDNSLRFAITEWMPAPFLLDPADIPLIALFLVLVWRYRTKIPPAQVMVSLFFFLLSMSAVRHIPLWVLTTIPVTVSGLNLLAAEAGKNRQGRERFERAGSIFLIFTLLIFLAQFYLVYQSALGFGESVFYPQKAVNYLKKNLPSRQIFAPYHWGGYLIWKLPEKEVFVDGRMPSWKQAPSASESASAFIEFNSIVEGKIDYQQSFAKYQITTVLWTKPGKQNVLLAYLNNEFDNVMQAVGLKKEVKPIPDLTVRLKTNGWKKVYEDSVAVIYEK